MKATKPLTIESIDVDNDTELDALMSHVLAEGDKIYQAQREEAVGSPGTELEFAL